MTKSTKGPLFAEVHNVPDDYHFTEEELDRIIAGDMFTPRQDAIMARELKEHRKTAEPELNPANIANKFYERYPLATFKSDSERAEAFGYFMAGAELQCFGEFIKYEDLCGDE